MGNKKYYLILFLALVITIFVLGLSYCKENKTTISYTSNEKNIEDARIVYSNRDIIDSMNNKTDLSIVNTSKETQTYLITFANLKENNSPVYINSVETSPSEPYKVTLNALGKENDHITLNIEGSKNDAYKINVAKEIIIQAEQEEQPAEENIIIEPQREIRIPQSIVVEQPEEKKQEEQVVIEQPKEENVEQSSPVEAPNDTQASEPQSIPQEEVKNES